MKRFLLLFRALLCVLFFIICGSAIRAHAEVIEVPIEVTFCQDQAREMLQYVNDFRTGNEAWYWNEYDSEKIWAENLQPLKYDYNLEKIAMQRAVEVALYMDMSHRRADGEEWYQTYADLNYNYGRAGENVTSSNSISYLNSFRAVEGLKENNFGYSGQGHRRNMLSSKWIVCGFGCVTYNGEIYYVQEFANENESISYVYTEPDLSTRICYSKATYDEDNPLYIDPIVLYKGDTFDLSTVPVCRAYNDDWNERQVKEIAVTPSFSAEDSSIAKISGNNLTALKAGTTQVTAKFDIKGKQYTIKTSVSVISFSIDKENAEMKPKETLQLNAKIEGAKDNDLKINWSSSNDSVASVNSKGLVTAKKTGSVKITARIGDSDKTVSCWIDVKIPIESVSLSENSITCKKGDSITLSVLRNPQNAAENEPVTWTIKNENGKVIAERTKKTSGYSSRNSGGGAIAFTSYDFNSASFSVIESGKATIIVTIGDKSAECSVTVKKESGNNQSPQTQEELVEAFVERFYTEILGRESEEAGLENWKVALLAGTRGGADVAFEFIHSEEFQNKKISDDEYITRLYHAFFNREPDKAGMKSWKKDLANGKGRDYVLNGFLVSDEFRALCEEYGIKRDSTRTFVRRFYKIILGRPDDKITAGELDNWQIALDAKAITGSDMARDWINTRPELLARELTDEEYVQILYNVVFDRDADPSGLATWTGELKSGKTRAEVLDAILASPEFQTTCAGYGIEAGK